MTGSNKKSEAPWTPGITALMDDDGKERMVLIGCDPGPVSSAYIAVLFDKVSENATILKAAYLYNNDPDGPRLFDEVYGAYAPDIVFAYETCTNYGRIVGRPVFDTAAMGGEIRGWYRGRSAVYGVPSPDWRRAVTGFHNANDSVVRGCLEEYFEPTGGGCNPYKGTKSAPGPWARIVEAGAKQTPEGKSNTQHIIDALGVVFGLIRMKSTTKREPEMFRIY